MSCKTDRDRLIELIEDGFPEYVEIIQRTTVEALADYLLANGVIVPPCKVGDMVYMVTPNGNIRNLTVLGIDIELEKKEVKMTCLAVYEFEDKPCYLQIQYSKFGKTVFLTKKEAEAKLKECEGK